LTTFLFTVIKVYNNPDFIDLNLNSFDTIWIELNWVKHQNEEWFRASKSCTKKIKFKKSFSFFLSLTLNRVKEKENEMMRDDDKNVHQFVFTSLVFLVIQSNWSKVYKPFFKNSKRKDNLLIVISMTKACFMLLIFIIINSTYLIRLNLIVLNIQLDRTYLNCLPFNAFFLLHWLFQKAVILFCLCLHINMIN